MNLFRSCIAIARKYPMTLLFAFAFFMVAAYSYSMANIYGENFRAKEQRVDAFAVDSFYFKTCVARDSSKAAARLIKSMMILKERKDNVFDEATFYYHGIYFFSHILGIFSIIGGLFITLLVANGWANASTDLKLAIGGLFLVCSLSFFIPKLMDNERTYASCGAAYLNFNRQINYSVKVLSHHCCCNDSRNPDSLLNATADSNFTIINDNMSVNYQVNFNEASKYFDNLKSDNIFKK